MKPTKELYCGNKTCNDGNVNHNISGVIQYQNGNKVMKGIKMIEQHFCSMLQCSRLFGQHYYIYKIIVLAFIC